MTSTERRRNQYIANCKVCGCEVKPGEGWLYSDTKSSNSRSRRASTGRWIKVVKCDRCHTNNLAHKWQVDNLNRPVEPTIRPWSVSQVKKWAVIRGEQDNEVVLFLEGSFGRIKISERDSINDAFTAPSTYRLEECGIEGKPLSRAAAEELGQRIRSEVRAIADAEKASAEAARAVLTAAGATCNAPDRAWHCFSFTYAGGRYWLWGRVGRTFVSGLDATDKFVETTVEELIASH